MKRFGFIIILLLIMAFPVHGFTVSQTNTRVEVSNNSVTLVTSTIGVPSFFLYMNPDNTSRYYVFLDSFFEAHDKNNNSVYDSTSDSSTYGKYISFNAIDWNISTVQQDKYANFSLSNSIYNITFAFSMDQTTAQVNVLLTIKNFVPLRDDSLLTIGLMLYADTWSGHVTQSENTFAYGDAGVLILDPSSSHYVLSANYIYISFPDYAEQLSLQFSLAVNNSHATKTMDFPIFFFITGGIIILIINRKH